MSVPSSFPMTIIREINDETHGAGCHDIVGGDSLPKCIPANDMRIFICLVELIRLNMFACLPTMAAAFDVVLWLGWDPVTESELLQSFDMD